MKVSGFNKIFEGIKNRWIVFRECIKYNLQIELAYPASNWGSILSTLFYSLALIFFIEVVYLNVTNVVGYDRNQMLLMFLVGQSSFYICWSTWYKGIEELPQDISNGRFDLILTKPLDSKFYTSVHKARIFVIFREGILPMTILSSIIDWKGLNLEPLNILVGIVISILGMISFHNLMIITVIPSFWFGRIESLHRVMYNMYDLTTEKVPLEGFPDVFKIVFTYFFPLLFITGYSSSVILEKSSRYSALILAIVITIIFQILARRLWKYAIKNYTSASS
ncbi:MAG: ABC-2 family transporter protein [bacterium]